MSVESRERRIIIIDHKKTKKWRDPDKLHSGPVQTLDCSSSHSFFSFIDLEVIIYSFVLGTSSIYESSFLLHTSLYHSTVEEEGENVPLRHQTHGSCSPSGKVRLRDKRSSLDIGLKFTYN
jgi:hypothetical protein